MIVLLLTVGDLYAAIVILSNIKRITNWKSHNKAGVYYRAVAMEYWREFQIRVCAVVAMIMLFFIFVTFVFHRPWLDWTILTLIFGLAGLRVFIHFRLKNCVRMSDEFWRIRGEAEDAKRTTKAQGEHR